jgi:hypothetical protein
MNPGKVALRISTKPGLPRTVLRPWKIGDISVFLNGYNNEPPTDSIRYKDMTIFYEGKLRVRPKVLYDRLKFRPGDLYSQQQQEKTQTGFSRFRHRSSIYPQRYRPPLRYVELADQHRLRPSSGWRTGTERDYQEQ